MYNPCGTINHKVYNTNIFVNGNSDEKEWQQWKEHLQAIISQVPEKPDYLKPVVQFLVVALAPSQIYCLNHSFAGSKKEDPYIHFCLVIPNRCTTPFTELEPVLEMVLYRGTFGYPNEPDRMAVFLLCIAVGIPAFAASLWLCAPRTPRESETWESNLTGEMP